MEQHATRQRIKYLIEHGEVYPPQPMCTKGLRRLFYVVIGLQVVMIALHFVH